MHRYETFILRSALVLRKYISVGKIEVGGGGGWQTNGSFCDKEEWWVKVGMSMLLNEGEKVRQGASR